MLEGPYSKRAFFRHHLLSSGKTRCWKRFPTFRHLLPTSQTNADSCREILSSGRVPKRGTACSNNSPASTNSDRNLRALFSLIFRSIAHPIRTFFDIPPSGGTAAFNSSFVFGLPPHPLDLGLQ